MGVLGESTRESVREFRPTREERMAEETDGVVLIIEDEPELRFVINAHLRAAGFDVLEAGDAATGLELATVKCPDLVIMDIGLPGMDGVEATRALRRDCRTSDIPVIMLTGRTGAEDVVRGLEAGADEYLAKPFDMTELLARVRTVHRLARTRKDLDKLNSHLEAEVDAKTKRLQLLYHFMRDLNQSKSRDDILDLIIRCVERVTSASRISLLLRNGASDALICERAVGIDADTMQRIHVTTAEGIAGQVFRSGKTFSAKAYSHDPNRQTTYAQNAFLSTPLVAKLETQDGVLGVLNVTDKPDETPFSEEEVECVRSIADGGAIALDNDTRRMQLQQSVRVLLQTVGHLAEYRDEETTRHLDRVARMSRILANELARSSSFKSEMSEDFVEFLIQAAPMHDIGKVGIPDDILTKPGALTDEEFQIMKTHTEIGRRVLSQALDPTRPVPLLQMCIDIVHGHHERFDGTGYPRRVAGKDTPLAARIIALVDAYDAITSKRRYKKAKSHEQAVEIIKGDSGTHFDPAIVEVFLRCHTQFDDVRRRFGDGIEETEPAMMQ